MSKYTITPWRHPRDLLEVRTQLYGTPSTPPTPTEQRKAISRIHAWKLRGNLPHAVESTALLLDATLHHHQQSSASEPAPRVPIGASDFPLRATYTAAFTRFVTGFCDIGRSKDRTLEVRSMLEIAREIGMPGDFVALRHEATHEEMPSLRRLVGAVERGLEWLWGVYWRGLEGEGEDEVESEAAGEEVRGVLREFRRGRRDELRGGKGGERLRERAREVCEKCVMFCGRGRGGVEGFTKVLVEDRLLLPASRELGASLEGAFLIWDDLLDMCFSELPSFRRSLVEAFMRTLEQPSQIDPAQDVDREGHAMWLLHVLEESQTPPVDVVKWCCLHPGHWSEFIGERVLQDYSSVAEWRDLFEASLLTAGSVTAERQSETKDHEMADVHATSSNHMDLSGGVGWSRAIAPIAVPIGVVP